MDRLAKNRTPLAQDASVTIARKLDLLVYVVLDQKLPSLQEKINKLAEIGLDSGEIAKIVNKPSNQISAAIKKGRKK